MLQWLRGKAENFVYRLNMRTALEKQVLLALSEVKDPIRVGQVNEIIFDRTGSEYSLTRLNMVIEWLADEEFVEYSIRTDIRNGFKTAKPHFSITLKGEREISKTTWEEFIL